VGAVQLPWYAALPCALLAAAALHGISLFTHEAVHGVLFRNRTLNHLFGALCAWPVLQNFAAYRVLHLRHHAQLGVEGDPDHFENYTRRRWLVYAMHWGRLLLGYPAYLLAIPVLAFRQGTTRDRFFLSLETAAAAGLLTLACLTLPTAWIVYAWLIPMAFINTMVNIRGMSQHTLLAESADVVHGTRTILTNPVTRFFMCNENYHLEHHLYPGVPWYRLPALHTALRPQLDALDAPFIPSYAAFARDFVQATMGGNARNTVTLR
jgi:fatty acid desaturase